MEAILKKSMDENHIYQKDYLVHKSMQHFMSPRFTHEDRQVIANMRKQDYKDGFVNCFKMLKKFITVNPNQK